MPVIKPFTALKPAKKLQEKVVTRPLEYYSTGEARLIASENEYSFLHLINPELDNQYLRGTRQELIYKKIAENLEHYIEKDYLDKEQKPCMYIYRVSFNGMVQTGIWCLTHIGDYQEGKIKKHEHTVERRERMLADYLQQTGLDANPVLITFKPDETVSNIISKYTQTAPSLDFTFSDASHHQVWTIADTGDIQLISDAFAGMESVYIADGHHRIASMTKMGQHKAALNKNHHGDEPYNYFTTVYMDMAQVKVLEFNRLIRDTGNYSPDEFISRLEEKFTVRPVGKPVKPHKLHELGMYLKGQWYILNPKPAVLNDNDPVDVLDVSILHDHILAPLLNITDPRTDARLSFEGGLIPVETLQKQVDNNNFGIAFTLFPTSIEQLTDVADAGLVMPPKSTWVEPKFLVGLLTHYFN